MPRRQVNFAPGHYYHLYNRGNDRQTIFFERENYLHFLRQFRRYLVEDTLDVLAYCLMPNHYHFLVRLRSPHLSQQMQAFSLSYTKAINRRRLDDQMGADDRERMVEFLRLYGDLNKQNEYRGSERAGYQTQGGSCL